MFRILIGLLLIITVDVPDSQPFLGLGVFLCILAIMIWGAHDINKTNV